MNNIEDKSTICLNKLSPKVREIIKEAQASLPMRAVDIESLCKRLGIAIEKRSDMPRNISSCIRTQDNSCKIFYNGNHPLARQRFTVAHELAHCLLHKNELQEEYLENILLRGGLSNQLESEANRLGADILMPSEAIDKYTARHKALSIVDMAYAFGVSPHGMSVRLGFPLDL